MIGYAIAIIVVLGVLGFTFYNLRLQEKELTKLTSGRLVMQKLEPALIHVQVFESSFNNATHANTDSAFLSDSKKLEDDWQIFNGFATKYPEDANDYRQLDSLIHRLTVFAAGNNNISRKNAAPAIHENVSSFREIAERLEDKNRTILNHSYGLAIHLTSKTVTYVGFISGVMVIALLISFVSSYRDLRNRLSYHSDLERQVNEKTVAFKLAEEKTLASERNLRSVLTSTADDFYVIGHDYHVTLINEMAKQNLLKAWGKPVNVGDNMLAVFSPDKRDTIKSNYDKVLGGEKINYEVNHPIDDQPSWFSVSYIPVRNEQGEITGACISTKNVTERRKAEQEIRESSERYRSLVEYASDALVVFNVDTQKFVNVSESASRLFHMSKEALMEVSPADISPEYQPDGRRSSDAAREWIGQAIKGEKPSFEWTHCDAKGNEMLCEVWLVRLPGDNPTLVRGSIIDISARKKVEKEIITARDLADNIVDSLPGIFYLYDEQGNLIRWNKYLEDVTGYTSSEIAGMKPVDFFYGEQKDYILERIGKVFAEGVSDAEASLLTKAGKLIPYYFKAVRMNYEGKTCLLGTGIDIAERVKFEHQLKESVAEIRQLTEYLQNIREEERTHIAREIHDELGQQLTVLKMDVSWLSKRFGNSDPSVIQKMNGLKEMLDSTVKTVRKISSELRPSLLDDIGLIAAMEWHLSEFGNRAGIDTRFIGADMAEPPITLPTKTGLYRIFQESLTNVARHAGAKKVIISLHQDDGAIILKIDDDGIGFDSENVAANQTLGILGMKERTAMMGGSYIINSKPGEGTVVEVSVPVNHS